MFIRELLALYVYNYFEMINPTCSFSLPLSFGRLKYSSSIVLSFCLLQINLSALKIRIFMVFPKAKLPTFHVELTHTRKPTRFLGLSILLVVAWIYPVILLQTKGLPAFCITHPRVKWIMERCFV